MTTIPPFGRITKDTLISLDLADTLETIATLIFGQQDSLRQLVIRYKEDGHIFGYIETETGQKDYFYRKITETRKYHYFTLLKKKIILPDYLRKYEAE